MVPCHRESWLLVVLREHYCPFSAKQTCLFVRKRTTSVELVGVVALQQSFSRLGRQASLSALDLSKMVHCDRRTVKKYQNLDVDRQDVRFRNGMSQYYLYKDGKLHFSPLTPPLIEEIVPLLDIEMDDGQSDDK